jgi:eukaryotic-like serine/threonine-protein kinase
MIGTRRMRTKRTCPQCGVEVAKDAPQGLCGQCLFLLGLSLPDTEPNASAGSVREKRPQAWNDAGQATECLPASCAPASANSDPIGVIRYFGDYELLEEIARGGMGVVYKARQVSLDRIVAVKMILGGHLARKEFVERFRQEARAAANLQHPNIVAIHEVGEHAGLHYFSMDYVEGQDLAEKVAGLKGGTVDCRRAARWLMTIAETIQYAHEQGTIHRDIKPSNILIDRNDQPRITDFGLAKSLKRNSELTVSGQVMGTPSFLPPEQASGSGVAVGPVSDIYAVGAVLYFLVTGRAPFVGETLEATLSQVLRQEPVPPRRLNPSVPRDLETICLKCLEKDPRWRYGSAQDLADELGRFLEGRPILARPAGPVGEVWRWCKRKPVVAALSAGLILALVLGLAGVTWQWQQAERARLLQRRLGYLAGIRAAQLAIKENKPRLALTLLRQHGSQPGEGEDLRGLEWQYLWQESRSDAVRTFSHPARLKDIALSPDGKWLVSLAWDDQVRVWDTSTGRLVKEFVSQSFPSPRKSLAFSANGAELVFPGPAGIEIVETSAWSRLQVLQGAGAPLCLSTDGAHLVSTGSDFRVQLWDLRTLTKTALPDGAVRYYNLALSPDGTRVAFGTANPYWGWFGQIQLWDGESGQVDILQEHSDSMSLAISPDGQWLASGHCSGEVCCWRLSERQLTARFKAHSGLVYALAFSYDSRLLATGGTDELICLWEPGTTNCLDRWSALGDVAALCFSQDGQTLASGGAVGRAARLWDLRRRAVAGHTFQLPSDAISIGSLPDDSALVTADAGGRTYCLWRLPDGLLIRSNVWSASQLRGCTELRCFPANQWAVGVSTNGTVHLWDLVTQAHLRTVTAGETGFTPAYVSGNGQWLLGYRFDGGGVLCDLRAGRTTAVFPALKSFTYPAAFSPDGRWLAYCTGSSTLLLWDLVAERTAHSLDRHESFFTVVRFSPDSQVLASGGVNADLKLWSVRTGKLLFPPLQGHQSIVRQIAFSPDGKTLVSCDTDLTTRWWNMATGQEMLLLQENAMTGGSEYLACESYYGAQADLSPGGKWLVWQGRQGLIRVTSLRSLAEIDASERAREEEERATEKRFAEMERERVERAERERVARATDEGAIKHWLVLGPIPVLPGETGAAALDRQQIRSEAELRPRAGERALLRGTEYAWRAVHPPSDVLDFNQAVGVPNPNSVAYAVCYLVSELPQAELRMKIGSDDQSKVYLNGQLVYEWREPRAFLADQDDVKVQLNNGLNVVVFKVVNETRDWQGSLRLTEMDGQPVKALRVTLAP